MITPRRTILVRAADLSTFQRLLASVIGALGLEEACDTALLVPTRAAAEELRRTLEDRLLADEGRRAVAWPLLVTRAELYETLASRLAEPPCLLTSVEREVMLGAVARAQRDAGLAPPFEIRPGLVAEMLALYDQLRRLGRSVADFDRNIRGELEREQETDRGAAQLLQQTRFLTATFDAYERRLAGRDAADEHVLRARLVDERPRRPLRRVVVTVGDRIAERDGLWPADFDLLTRLPALESLDVMATERVLAAGLLKRLHGRLPELEEAHASFEPARPPVLVHPPGDGDAGPAWFTYRDREEELSAIARRLKADRRRGTTRGLHRSAIVVQRPLPYLYLARAVFDDAGIPFDARDTLPLAAEPYAAAVDLALEAVAARFTRSTLLPLLRSPHYDFGPDVARALIPCDASLAEARYHGGVDQLAALVERWTAVTAPASPDERRSRMALPAAVAALGVARELAPLGEARPMTAQLETLRAWLAAWPVAAPLDDETRSRTLRVRGAVLGALAALRDAYRQHDPDATGEVGTVSSALRRWLGAQTFARRSGQGGVPIVEAQAARYGEFDDVQLVGLIDGEWPDRVRRNVLYPSSVLALLEPAVAVEPGRREREALHAARAAFHDLVHLAGQRVRLSTIVLEHDSVVEPSILLDDLEGYTLARHPEADDPTRIFRAEALALLPPAPEALDRSAAAWALARLAPSDERLRQPGEAGAWRMPRISVSRLERYLDCPFRFFASEVLGLDEQPEDEDTRTPIERGRFLHELFERFFTIWQQHGHGRIDAERLPDARRLFADVCEEALAALPPAEAALERARLLGTALGPGIAHRVFAMEAERPAEVVERLLEAPLTGEFTLHAADGRVRHVALRAKADRIDVLAGHVLRVIDYKSRKTPDPKRALQLPIYSLCARTSLERARGGRYALAEALYLSFEGDRTVVPLATRQRSLDDLLAAAEDRLIGTLDRIEDGHFPPAPVRRSLCGTCPYSTVCRREWASTSPDDEGADAPSSIEPGAPPIAAAGDE